MKPTVVLQTDFGSGGGGSMTGVIKSIDAEVNVYDFEHFVEPFNVVAASASLSRVTGVWPSGTIFVSVVDPGVGTTRRSCVAKLDNGSFIVTPDNGTLTMQAEHITEVRMIDESINRLPGSENCHIFNGRDVYAYTAGRLAAGVISYEEVGPAYPTEEIIVKQLTTVETIVRAGYAHAGFYDIEPSFGCLRVNLFHRDFREICGFAYGEKVHLVISDGKKDIFDDIAYYDKTFGLVPEGVPFICGDSQLGNEQKLRFSLNEDNFLEKYAPELKKGLHAGKDYSFTVTRLD